MSNNLEAFEQVVLARRSVRGYLEQMVSQETLNKIFALAQTAPSNCNTQPWEVHVASGELCQKLKDGFAEGMMKGEMSLDFPFDGTYEGVYKTRQYDAAAQLYSAMGIAREDKAGRQTAFFRNFAFFDAPHAAFLFLPEEFGIREAADLGMYAQNLMLSMTAHGVASCPMTALSFNADLVREVLGVSASKKLLFGIAFGYEDPSVQANNTRVGRAPVEDAVTFHQ